MDVLKVREAHPEDATAIARVHVDAWRETYRGIVPDSVLDALRYEDREAFWSGVLRRSGIDEIVYVAEFADSIRGFASGGPERTHNASYQSELYAIYVLRAAQKRGVGRKLFDAVVRRLIEKGHASMLVWVLERNPACGFYESMGGQRVDQKVEHFGSAALTEVAYGWGAGELRSLSDCGLVPHDGIS
jgi:GNAT superfamily N-acetyltransferase